MDLEVRLKAGAVPLVLGDTKEGTMALRLNEQMRVRQPKGKVGLGHILNSEGLVNGAAWGKRAAWCAYSGPVDGKVFTVALLDHPANPHFPTWWHVRDYGLFAANPFGQHDFEKAPPQAGALTISWWRLPSAIVCFSGTVIRLPRAEFASWSRSRPRPPRRNLEPPGPSADGWPEIGLDSRLARRDKPQVGVPS